jgi:hypothetical protein
MTLSLGTRLSERYTYSASNSRSHLLAYADQECGDVLCGAISPVMGRRDQSHGAVIADGSAAFPTNQVEGFVGRPGPTLLRKRVSGDEFDCHNFT